jgi:Zn-dependent protease with chaperone function
MRLVGPIARGQEARADRASAAIAGGRAAASALIKVALVQPIFRELLVQHDPDRSGGQNLYATFRALWDRLPEPLLEAMRLRLLVEVRSSCDSPHPPIADRVAMIQGYADRVDGPLDPLSAASLLGDPEWLEQMLHDRLFALSRIEPSVFHRAGT